MCHVILQGLLNFIAEFSCGPCSTHYELYPFCPKLPINSDRGLLLVLFWHGYGSLTVKMAKGIAVMEAVILPRFSKLQRLIRPNLVIRATQCMEFPTSKTYIS